LSIIPTRSAAESAEARPWRRFVLAFLGTLFAIITLVYAAIILIDPYDTGYFPSLVGPGVVDDNNQTSVAGRARDPQFDSAIFGNSHGLLLDPSRLSAASGLSFVQLTTLASGPREQLTVMRYFLRRHSRVRAIVLAADMTWCTHDPTLPEVPYAGYSFPYWLYSGNRLEYLAHMLSTRPFRLIGRRILIGMGSVQPANPAGNASYPAQWDFRARHDDVFPDRGEETATVAAAPRDTSFPAPDRLNDLLSAVPDDVAVVVVLPPIYYRWLPTNGTSEAAEFALCKQRLAQAVAYRSRGGFVDFLTDSPLSRDRENFADLDHMRENVALMIEDRIVQSLRAAR
jgi:hypothetical protein